MTKMPTIFIPHGGGPCFFMGWNPADEWDDMAEYLRSVPALIGQKPKAMLVISGHWEEATVTVQTNPAPGMLFDYHGFPPHTYRLDYPAPGDPNLAARVKGLLEDNGFAVSTNSERGFDHGAFIPLMVAFPAADIPVVQLSLHTDLDAAAHIAMGEALQPLRSEGVLIVGSGMTHHNMQVMMRNRNSSGHGNRAGEAFDNWLSETLTNPDTVQRNAQLMSWTNAPSARLSHPREEHLIPIHVVAGAAGADVGKKTLEDTVLGAVESAFQFG